MAGAVLQVIFGDWSGGELERWLPNEKDEYSITYKRFIWRPDDETKLFLWGTYEEFEKIALNRKGERTTNGNYVIAKIPEMYFLPIITWSDRNLQLIECDCFGGETVLSRRHAELHLRNQRLESEIDGFKAHVAYLSQELKDLKYKRMSEIQSTIEIIELSKKVGQRPLEETEERIKDETGK